MAKGLHDFINVIKKDPANKVLVHRFLVLIAEMADGDDKIRLLLELAHTIRLSIPFDALRLSHIIFQSVHDDPDYRTQNFDVAALGIVVSSLKELGRFAKASMVEMELEKLIASKRNRSPARRFTQKGVDRVVKEFTDEVSKLNGGSKEDSLGNILTQLARSKGSAPKTMYKLPDLDLFGKGEAEAKAAAVPQGTPTVLVVDDDVPFDAPSPLADNILERPNKTKKHPSMAEEHFHLPARASEREGAPVVPPVPVPVPPLREEAPAHALPDLYAAVDPLAASAAALSQEEKSAPVFDLGEDVAPKASSPDAVGEKANEDVFSLNLDGSMESSSLVIKRTPIVKAHDEHTIMAPVPVRQGQDGQGVPSSSPLLMPAYAARQVFGDKAGHAAASREAGAQPPVPAPMPLGKSSDQKMVAKRGSSAKGKKRDEEQATVMPSRREEGGASSTRRDEARDLASMFENYLKKGFLAETKDLLRGMMAEYFPQGAMENRGLREAMKPALDPGFKRTPVTSLNDIVPKHEGLSDAFWESLVNHLAGPARQKGLTAAMSQALVRGRLETWAESLARPLSVDVARELTMALLSYLEGGREEESRRELAAGLWRWLDDDGVTKWLQQVGLAAGGAALAWFYVDALISRRQFRRAWHRTRHLVMARDCRLAQAKLAYERLRVIHPRLGWQTFAWREDDGVPALQQHLQKRPLPMVSFYLCG